MEKFDIAASAAERWRQRAQLREQHLNRIRSGRGLEMESAERIQQRFDRLSANAIKASATASRVAHNAGTSGLVETIGLERVIGQSDLLDIAFVEQALAVARFVGRINVRSAMNRSTGYGTGFMVSPRLLLTNNHVLKDAGAAKHSIVEFDFQNDRSGRPLQIVAFALDPETFFMTDVALDFTLVAVRETSSGGATLRHYGWSRLIQDQGKALLGESLNIIQHPRGLAKQVVLRSNELVDLFDHYAHYLSDTEPGSSGSPVYNDQWEVVALHHSAVPKTDEQGRYVARDGSVWKPGMNPDNLAWAANEGIRVSSLVEHIKRQSLTGDQAKIRSDMLDLEPLSPVEAAIASLDSLQQRTTTPGAASGTASAVSGAPVLSENGATWTIPLSVTVQIGVPVPGAASQTEHSKPQPQPQPAPQPQPGNSGATGALTIARGKTGSVTHGDADLNAALAELDRARTKVYYDLAEDGKKVAAYYNDIDPTATGAELFASLHKLLKQTHERHLSYKPAVHVYPWVDLHPPGSAQDIVSIYSGKRFSARELIETDFEIEKARRAAAAARPGLAGQESFPNEDALESAMPYNCEHVVPQSWFDKKEPMRGDLHHLFACESGCNSFRGNLPYFDFADFEEVVRSGCGKRETLKFEPGSGKGAAARATLYFLLRYPGQINRTAKEYTEERIEILLRWHELFSVDEYEHHRNAAIHEKQGNRNPLIDFPDWAGRIDFMRGLG